VFNITNICVITKKDAFFDAIINYASLNSNCMKFLKVSNFKNISDHPRWETLKITRKINAEQLPFQFKYFVENKLFSTFS
jgi:hypothetical protein